MYCDTRHRYGIGIGIGDLHSWHLREEEIAITLWSRHNTDTVTVRVQVRGAKIYVWSV